MSATAEKSAVISECGKFRYSLSRVWNLLAPVGTAKLVNFVMLNPSTADAEADDPTIRRCVGFAKSWGFDGLVVTNLYPLRATSPAAMQAAANRLGQIDAMSHRPLNEMHVAWAASRASFVLCAWGAHAEPVVAAKVLRIIRGVNKTPCALKFTKDGHPSHPLYLPATATPLPIPQGRKGKGAAL